MKRFLRILAYVLSFGLLVASLIGLWFRQDIYDWYRLRDYTPSSEIKQLAEHTTMTGLGKKLFYVHDPHLADEQAFATACNQDERTIVLGCYISHRAIYIFDVEDPRLQGIREVTAAHEMLHAAYDRFSDNEQRELDILLVSYYDKIKHDNPRLKELITSYYERDQSVVGNELHSILPTEIETLPAELEEHYKQYFVDRAKVVAYAKQYESVFVAQQERIKDLSAQISQLEGELKTRQASIKQEEAAIEQEFNRLEQLRDQGDVDAYNAAVPGYNRQVNAYRSTINQYNRDVQKLNNLIKQYNATAIEQRNLYDAIDSRVPQG